MKQEEIIEMAGQAGIPFNKWGMIGCEDCEQDIDQNLVAFAKLVAAKERERIVILLKSLGTNTNEDGGEDEPTRDDCIFAIKGEA